MQARIEKMQDASKNRETILTSIEAHRLDTSRMEEEKRQASRIDAAIANLPPRFRGKTFVDFKVDFVAQEPIKRTAECYIATFSKRLQEASCLTFIGKPGTGKTLLALIMYQALVKSGFVVEYQPTLNFLRLLQEKQYESHAAFENLLSHYKKLPFLIIDEVTEGCGKSAMPADWERHMLRMLIDVRYQAERCTLVISNRNKTELIERLGEPTMDRLSENGATLVFTWPSYRKSN